jgi:hypothetical protein
MGKFLCDGHKVGGKMTYCEIKFTLIGGVDGELALECVNIYAVKHVNRDNEKLKDIRYAQGKEIYRVGYTCAVTMPFQKSNGRFISAMSSMKSIAPLATCERL